MQNQSRVPYRGYTIEVRVTQTKSPSLDGQQLRYTVAWLILSAAPLTSAIASLPEHLNFLSAEAAFAYAERQARRFIDGCKIDPALDGAAT
ncbi:hypothetical protein FVF58_41030 [Paraburkholderia panacisoli]|uniref:Uncharacterized protein n=1 Tax=Paraburkholderia panacisoli TaxID=2603818 RepID=A0A5B0GB40_9BURK|nr:hypothetical protein [Paraburkholderia panacisoli]KAA0999985.1 hypothetical protein FVF58_41030 [Paraburkholderia panacisoli]